VNPVRKACLEEAAKLWADQPSLGMLETANEVRVIVRGRRDLPAKELPGVESIRKWLADAIAAGEMAGPQDDGRRSQTSRSRRQGQ
jgi:hypothetical protein